MGEIEHDEEHINADDKEEVAIDDQGRQGGRRHR